MEVDNMFNEKPYVIVIDRGGNLFKIKEKTMQKILILIKML